MKKALAIGLSVFLSAGVAFAASEGVEELNELLRGELSAIETYRQALEKVGTEPQASTLRAFLKDHETAADTLKTRITAMGGKPDTDSGAWGTWAKTVEGTAKLFGDATALQALKQGEEHGLSEHKEVVADADVPLEIRKEIETKFVPRQQEHIKKLDEMISKLS